MAPRQWLLLDAMTGSKPLQPTARGVVIRGLRRALDSER